MVSLVWEYGFPLCVASYVSTDCCISTHPGDGDVDLAGIAFQRNGSSGACVLYVLENVSNCSGQWIVHYLERPDFVVSSLSACHFHAHDLDGDHDIDFILASREIPGRFLIFRNQPSKFRQSAISTLWHMSSQNVSRPFGIIDITAASLDSSMPGTSPDLLLSFGGFGASAVGVSEFARLSPLIEHESLHYREVYGPTGASFLAPFALPQGSVIRQAIDVNNDGVVDIEGFNVLGSRPDASKFAFACLRDDSGSGTVNSCAQFPLQPPSGLHSPFGGNFRFLAVVWIDLNMDGLVDYVVSGREFVGWYEQIPSGSAATLAFQFHFVLASMPIFTSIFDSVSVQDGDDLQVFDFRDIDHDGDLDVFVVSRDGGNLNYFVWCENMERQTGDVSFVHRRLASGLNQISAIGLGDIDSDGYDDLISSFTDFASGTGTVRAVFGSSDMHVSASCNCHTCAGVSSTSP